MPAALADDPVGLKQSKAVNCRGHLGIDLILSALTRTLQHGNPASCAVSLIVIVRVGTGERC
jgi:hypothetical protein